MAFAWIEQKRHYRRYKARVAALPPNYRTAAAGMERYINHLGGIGDAESILTMLDDFADLVEQGAASGTPVREIFDDDPVEFAETLATPLVKPKTSTALADEFVVPSPSSPSFP